MMRRSFFFVLSACLLLSPAAASATINICNRYSTKYDQLCSIQADCPDADANDGGTGDCETVAGVEVDICNRWSTNSGLACVNDGVNEEVDCPDLSGSDGGTGACGVPLRQTAPSSFPSATYRYPGPPGSSSFVYQDHTFRQAVDTALTTHTGAAAGHANVTDGDKGDVTITSGAWAVEDDSHSHTTTTISGLDISADTNLAVTAPITLTGDTVGIDQAANYTWTGIHTFDSDAVQINDTDGSHQLIITPGSNLTLDRVLTITTGDAARTITLTGDTTLTGTNTGDQTITLTGDVTGSGTGSFAATIAANSVALTTDTTGNYVVDVAGTSNEVSVSHTPAEGSTATISLPATVDLSGKTAFIPPTSAGASPTASGRIAYDSTSNTLEYGENTTNRTVANLDGTQTLSNKTLTTPTIGSFANANHNHTNSAGGGQLTDAALSAAVGVAKGGTGIASGTSGGVPYFSGATTIASSAALTNNALVLGGGAGAAPKVSTGLTTNGTAQLNLGLAGTSTGVLTFSGSTSGTVTMQPAAAAGTWTMTLPTSAGQMDKSSRPTGLV